MIAGGLAFFAAGSWMMGGLNADAGYWDFFWPRALQGFALGFIFVPLSTDDAEPDPARGDGRSDRHLYAVAPIRRRSRDRDPASDPTAARPLRPTQLASGVTLGNPADRRATPWPPHHTAAIAALNGAVSRTQQCSRYDYMFRLCAILFVISMPSVLLLGTRKAGWNRAPLYPWSKRAASKSES